MNVGKCATNGCGHMSGASHDHCPQHVTTTDWLANLDDEAERDGDDAEGGCDDDTTRDGDGQTTLTAF